MAQKTPLYDHHLEAGGKIVEFAGWLLPIQYPAGILAEHKAVRQECGLFDVSHMGELTLCGSDAEANVQNLITNDIARMKAGRVRYSPMCNERGGFVDDVLIYKRDAQDFLIVVNAANCQKDAAWVESHLFGDVRYTDISAETAQLALQGPKAEDVLAHLADRALLPQKYYTFTEECSVAGKKCIVSRTGYTAEDGFEIYCKNEDAPELWQLLLNAGAKPCALGARDTLRLEGALPLYGHEMDEDVTPYEAALGSFVKLDKERFIGKDALVARTDPDVIRVGLALLDRGIAREGADVYHEGRLVGHVTSGTHSPTLGRAIAMARVETTLMQVGTVLEIDVRGKKLRAEVVPLPFYKRA